MKCGLGNPGSDLWMPMCLAGVPRLGPADEVSKSVGVGNPGSDLRVDADVVADDELKPSQSDPVVRQHGKAERLRPKKATPVAVLLAASSADTGLQKQ